MNTFVCLYIILLNFGTKSSTLQFLALWDNIFLFYFLFLIASIGFAQR